MRTSWKIAAVAFFALSLVLGGFFGDRLLALDKEAREQLHLYTELLTVAQEAYGGEVTYRDLVVSSIDGMVRTLDPHTTFLTAEAYSGMRDRQQSSLLSSRQVKMNARIGCLLRCRLRVGMLIVDNNNNHKG